jgi:hypothetical protein
MIENSLSIFLFYDFVSLHLLIIPKANLFLLRFTWKTMDDFLYGVRLI